MSGDYDDERDDISGYDDDERGDISGDNVRYGFRSQETIQYLFKIVEKVLMVMGEVDICLRPATIPPITQVTMIYCCPYLLIIVVFTKLFIVIQEVILVAMAEVVDLCLK